jgi:hypothetical protein
LIITINALTITDEAQSINLNFSIFILAEGGPTFTPPIPENSIIILPSASGEFGFEISLDLSAEKLEEAGIDVAEANLFHVSSTNRVSTYRGRFVSNPDGSVTITIDSASYYVFTTGEYENPIVDPPVTTATIPPNPPSTTTTNQNPPTGVTIGQGLTATIVAGVIALFSKLRRKHKKD